MEPGLELAFPWVLLALPLLLLLPRRGAWPLRAAELALLLLALSGPRLAGGEGEAALLVDVSDSVGDAAISAAAELAPSAWPQPPRLLYFAGEAGEVSSLEERPPAVLESEATDLARALQVAAAGGAGRIVLLSDGAESRGDALQALPPVPIDTVYVPGQANASLSELLAPEQAAPGERVEVLAVVSSDLATTVTLRPTVDGAPLPPLLQEVPAGRSVIPFSIDAGERGTRRVAARLDVGYRQPAADDERGIDIGVSVQPPVLVLGDPAMARLLAGQGFEVIEGDESDVAAPLSYSAVVLRAGAASFTPGQLEVLRSFVEEGGGLLMTGGPDSFGFGGWYRTPLEAVLPVDTDLRTEVELPLVALVIVLDRSQSMSTGNPNKLELAKEGALGVVELAYEEDLLGLIAFSDDFQWVFDLRPATARGKLEMVSSILSLGTTGGTILGPAYREALRALEGSEASIKHVIILSDGKLYDDQGPFGGGGPSTDFAAMAVQGREAGITTSTIAVGESADFERLAAIAARGGGRYYRALDVSTLPTIFTNEALTATRSLLRDETLRPLSRRHALNPRSGPLPPIDAYIATTLKSDAEALFVGRDDEPVLAVRRHGLGRTAAFTSDLNAWAGELARSQALPATLATVVRWLQAQPESYAASAERQDGEVLVVVDAVSGGEYVEGASLEARHGGRTVPLEQVAPGRYEGRLPAVAGQDTVLVVEGGEIRARAELSGPHPEFSPGDPSLLYELSARSGGQVLEDPLDYRPSVPGDGLAVWPYALAAAAALFLAELLLRRFGAPRLRSRGSAAS